MPPLPLGSRSLTTELPLQAGNPFAFCADLIMEKAHDLTAPHAQIQCTRKPREALFPRGKPFISLGENSAACFGI